MTLKDATDGAVALVPLEQRSKTDIIGRVPRLRDLPKKINIAVLRDEPMHPHTSFRIGGPADLFLCPRSTDELRDARRVLSEAGIPVLAVGGGANILVSDAGVRGAVVDTSQIVGVELQAGMVRASAGEPVSDLAARCARAGWAGLENFYAMPGRVGGSVWMNARCYDRSMSDVLSEVELLWPNGTIETRSVAPQEFSYKLSPFQSMDAIILSAAFRLHRADPAAMEERMAEVKRNRQQKGHFAYPCAGSVFKNNRAFGDPTGKLIDRLGLRGLQIGGARVSELHANIIVNAGGASADDVMELVRLVEDRVRTEYGFRLERELIPVGDWGDRDDGKGVTGGDG